MFPPVWNPLPPSILPISWIGNRSHHGIISRQTYIYSHNFAPKPHLLMFFVKCEYVSFRFPLSVWVDVGLAGKIISRCRFGGKNNSPAVLYGNGFLLWSFVFTKELLFDFLWGPEFRILESEFQFSDSPDIGIQEKFSDRNLRNRKWDQNSASDGGPRNRNQKSEFPT